LWARARAIPKKVIIELRVLEMWLFDVVNNKRNSIDVDKWDYIARDTHAMNIKYGAFDFNILLKGARVIEN
jgi:HD superfamily phosphohydrolase